MQLAQDPRAPWVRLPAASPQFLEALPPVLRSHHHRVLDNENSYADCYRPYAATPVAGALGADITGVDLSKDLDNESFDAIHQALLDHCVIFFKDQDITPEQQLDFAKRFGGIHHHPYMQGMPNHPDIFEIFKTPVKGGKHTPGSPSL
mgnify:CR=1 FL=1